MKKFFLLYLTLFLAICSASAQTPKHVLFIGNSYTEVNDLPRLVQQVSESAGAQLDYQSNTPGGCTFQQHCANQSMDLIRQGGWDVVVLQEQSQLPSFPESQVTVECLPYAARLVDSVYAHSPEGEAMFYMTWGRQNGDQQNAQYFSVLGTYEGMDSMLYERYMRMGRDNDASVCPVGRVWRYLRASSPDINLYSDDGSHPSLAGSYAGACAFYTMIFRQSPRSITFLPAGLDSLQASTIRSAVDTVVWNNLSFWLRQADTIPDTTQQDTTHADTTHIDTTQAAVRMLASDGLLRLFPNPAADQVALQLPLGASDVWVELYDMRGCLRRASAAVDGRVSLRGLPQGVYAVRVRCGGQVYVSRLIKK